MKNLVLTKKGKGKRLKLWGGNSLKDFANHNIWIRIFQGYIFCEECTIKMPKSVNLFHSPILCMVIC